MKILMVNKFLYPKGGAETYMLELGEWLEKHGCEIQYFGMADKRNVVGNKLALETKAVDFHTKSLSALTYPARIVNCREAGDMIGDIIDDFKPDAIHLNNINFQLTPSVIETAYKKDVPCVQTVHDLQMLCPNHLMFDLNTEQPCEDCLTKSRIGCVKKRCIHGSAIKSLIGAYEAVYWEKREVYKLISKYICPSLFIENMLLRRELYRGKTVFMRNFSQRKTPDSAITKQGYVLYFGRLSVEKGIKYIINAARLLPDINFVIAGGGPLEEICRNAERFNSNIKFVGFITGKLLNDLIQAAEFSLYPSVWYENCPMSVIESQTLGTPVIASGLGGIPELVENGRTGIIVDDIKTGLADAVRKLYDDKRLIAEMSANCAKIKVNGIDAYGENLIELYKTL